MKVKYRSGYPTNISMQEAIDTFFVDTFNKPRIGFQKGVLIWERNGINERVDEFKDYLKSVGIEVERHTLRDSPRVGSIILKKKG
jgi:hypothetical protein